MEVDAMGEDFRKASVLMILSVLAFAMGDFSTQNLTENYSVMSVLSFRCAVAFAVLFIYSIVRDRPLRHQIVFEWKLYAWSVLFAVTIIMYAFAFSKAELSAVYVITALMPIFVIIIEKYITKTAKDFGGAIIWPVMLMLLASLTASVYAFFYGRDQQASWHIFAFALAAAICHAWWQVGLDYVKGSHTVKLTKICMYMFLTSAVSLMLLAMLWFMQVVEYGLRPDSHIHEFRFLLSHNRDILLGLMGGTLSALGVLFYVNAASYARPSSIAAYEYTLIIWALLLGWLFPNEKLSQPHNVIAVRIICAVIIVIGGVWLTYVKGRPKS